MSEWEGRRVLVVGNQGLVGKELVELLKEKKAWVCGFDIKNIKDENVLNPEDIHHYFDLFGPFDDVFSCFGVKGSVRMTKNKPVDFMYPMLVGDANIIKACQDHKVKRMLYTSSIALLNFNTDEYPATAKATAEKLIEAMRIQYPHGTKYSIVRPSSIYGKYENFDREGLMVMSDLIKQALNSQDGTLKLWDNGEGVRDFINAKDVAEAMILVMEKMPKDWVAIGGEAYTIKHLKLILGNNDGSKDIRTIFTPHLTEWGWRPTISLENGIKETIQWKKKQQ